LLRTPKRKQIWPEPASIWWTPGKDASREAPPAAGEFGAARGNAVAGD
jgi:hypothetical protein